MRSLLPAVMHGGKHGRMGDVIHRMPAVAVDTRGCGDGRRGRRQAVVTDAPWQQGASVPVPPEAETGGRDRHE